MKNNEQKQSEWKPMAHVPNTEGFNLVVEQLNSVGSLERVFCHVAKDKAGCHIIVEDRTCYVVRMDRAKRWKKAEGAQ